LRILSKQQANAKDPFYESPDWWDAKGQQVGMPAADVCLAHGLIQGRFCTFRSKDPGGMVVSDAVARRGLAEEKTRLKPLPAAIMADNLVLKDLPGKNGRRPMKRRPAVLEGARSRYPAAPGLPSCRR